MKNKKDTKISIAYNKEDDLFHVCIGDSEQHFTFSQFHMFWYKLKRQVDRAWLVYDRKQRSFIKDS